MILNERVHDNLFNSAIRKKLEGRKLYRWVEWVI